MSDDLKSAIERLCAELKEDPPEVPFSPAQGLALRIFFSSLIFIVAMYWIHRGYSHDSYSACMKRSTAEECRSLQP